MSEPIATTVTFMDGPLALQRKVLTIERQDGFLVQVGQLRDAGPLRYWDADSPVQTTTTLTYRLHRFALRGGRYLSDYREHWLGFLA